MMTRTPAAGMNASQELIANASPMPLLLCVAWRTASRGENVADTPVKKKINGNVP